MRETQRRASQKAKHIKRGRDVKSVHIHSLCKKREGMTLLVEHKHVERYLVEARLERSEELRNA
jgi:hypothetical protein